STRSRPVSRRTSTGCGRTPSRAGTPPRSPSALLSQHRPIIEQQTTRRGAGLRGSLGARGGAYRPRWWTLESHPAHGRDEGSGFVLVGQCRWTRTGATTSTVSAWG